MAMYIIIYIQPIVGREMLLVKKMEYNTYSQQLNKLKNWFDYFFSK